MNYEQLAQQIKIWGKELGFQKVGICDVDLSEHEAALQKWLDAGYHGSMDWMARHGMMRARPDELLPGTVRVISVRMDYLPPEARFASNLANTNHAYISRYALGRDYHKLVRKQLNKLGKLIEQEVGQFGYRPFVDSAPILERPLAQKAGLGWTGKHSLILDKDCGSWFFLGELLIDLPLPVDEPSVDQCDKCKACITSCPTQAIVDEKIVDARRCISYLTIEFDGVIPEEFRKPMGNRIYGCDDCQLVCPWNRYAEITEQEDFHRRESFEEPDLVTMFNWDESTFLKQMEGSAIRRIGHLQWLRNISVALGNAEYSQLIIEALEARQGENKLLDEHIEWALEQQFNQIPANQSDSIDTKKKRLIRVVEKGLPRDA
ncbi:tRNA epoxyqueuosine(34) reductase QueG [Vibrio rotiferianus]|jgi:epoxyqueuosine reductase|uniref:Epoxyqueuosine reductase n=1 Tax=Vibrio rotiferianus TaxID=190895 RepID=A0A2K7SSB2_9VIBR|nr:tRNA epoxyqueuosine(34) reductase QueG [Vibrio rotiferianus]ASI95235.1 tRNA epoxyqueuosine(34) reductase QueG [Vibrio rotiferianus]OHY91427.1 tRNA epoxyqueuosine(34) reductase QueG [Vibrio rotiferianus]TMX34968.1 tRNA epoxyqueuosine(34) reductase QueG [Vibrio rotiferianus]TMX44536.1 tRNA epoxyqueuosine(34) reductase QueG [Vibrio rotiferianus]TMX60918.1 tRNA epoxyqueuosine(34) reductase QueG [Vibrio rotiferianus]